MALQFLIGAGLVIGFGKWTTPTLMLAAGAVLYRVPFAWDLLPLGLVVAIDATQPWDAAARHGAAGGGDQP